MDKGILTTTRVIGGGSYPHELGAATRDYPLNAIKIRNEVEVV
jgi:hypothetical protein